MGAEWWVQYIKVEGMYMYRAGAHAVALVSLTRGVLANIYAHAQSTYGV